VPRPSRLPEILEAAAEVFQKKGYHAASLDDVASAANVWKGSLYHYFDTKEELLLAIVREPAERLLADATAAAAADLPVAEKVRTLIRLHGRVLDETFVHAAVYLQEIAGRGRSEEFAEMDRKYVELVGSIIEEGKADGTFAEHLDVRVATFSLIGALNWVVRWYRPGGEATPTVIAGQIGDVFLQGLLARRR
jgi:AcrR family transcriptional regulator